MQPHWIHNLWLHDDGVNVVKEPELVEFVSSVYNIRTHS